MSMDGISMMYSFNDPKAKSRRTTQFFTMWDNLAIYHDGWVAATTPHVMPWDLLSVDPPIVNGAHWELYNVGNDYSEAHNLADRYPERLRQLQELYWAEAARNGALPIHRNEGGDGKPSWTANQTRFTFFPGTVRLPTAAAPLSINRSFDIVADLDVPDAGANGVIVTHGGLPGGYSFYVKNNRLIFHYNLAGLAQYHIVAQRPLSTGAHRVEMRFDYDGGGNGKGGAVSLLEDGVRIGQGRVEKTLPRLYSLDAQFDVGEDTGSPISDDYALPFRLSGLKRVEFTYPNKPQ